MRRASLLVVLALILTAPFFLTDAFDLTFAQLFRPMK